MSWLDVDNLDDSNEDLEGEGYGPEDEHVVFLDEDPDVFFLNSGIDFDPDEDHFNFCADMLVEWFIRNPGWYSRAEVLVSGIIPPEEWRDAIDELVNDGHVERKGRGRKARYRLIPEAGDHLLLDWLQEHPGWHKRADVLADIGQWLKAPEWRRAIRRLVNMGVVERTGQSSRTRYRAVPSRAEGR